MVDVDGVPLHQRDDHEAAAEGEGADLERGPGERAEPAGGGRRGAASIGAGASPERRRRAPAPQRELDRAAGEQDEHEVGADQRRRDAPATT